MEATRNFERAVELDPRNMDFLMNAGETYQSLHRYSDSSRLYERALAISPHDYFARILHALQPFLEHADVQPLRRELNAILTEEPSAADKIADVLFQCAILERDAAATARAVAAIPKDGISPGGNFVHPREWFVGVAARTFQDTTTAQAYFTAARAIEEKVVLERPD